jgi:hypothetical protein
MVLSDDTDTDMIKTIAHDSRFIMKEIFRKKMWGEEHFIFNIITAENF